MDVNRILENYVIRQVFGLVGAIFLVFGGRFGDFFWPRLLGASLNYAFLGDLEDRFEGFCGKKFGRDRDWPRPCMGLGIFWNMILGSSYLPGRVWN